MGINSFKRYERKFFISDKQKEALMPLLLDYLEFDNHCKDGKAYKIYNVYYDTLDNDLIRKSIMKPVFKEKVRLRCYKENVTEDDFVFLEIKRKCNKIVTKRRTNITLKEADDFVLSRKLPVRDDYISNQILNELNYLINIYDIAPKTYISYERIAMFGKEDKDLRLTFDKKILTRRENVTLSSKCYGEDILPEGKCLMEIKISGAMPFWLSNVLASLKIYPHSFSKYGEEYRKKVTK